MTYAYGLIWPFELRGEDAPIFQYHPPEARFEALFIDIPLLKLVFR